MYRAVLLPKTQRDLHRFVWRRNGRDELRDYRMTRLTFGVSASSFAANMAIKRNAVLHERSHPRAALAVHESFYVDDGLTGANSIPEATSLQNELQELFELGGFLLRKWKSNEPAVLRHLPSELVDKGSSLELPAEREFTKVLGIEWNTEQDSLRLAPGIFSSGITLTKRALASNVARVYDILGWYSPAVIKIKILLQQLWTLKIGWDDVVPSVVQQTWEKWEQGLPALGEQLIPRCYFPKGIDVTSVQLHGYCDASEVAYGSVQETDYENHSYHYSMMKCSVIVNCCMFTLLYSVDCVAIIVLCIVFVKAIWLLAGGMFAPRFSFAIGNWGRGRRSN